MKKKLFYAPGIILCSLLANSLCAQVTDITSKGGIKKAQFVPEKTEEDVDKLFDNNKNTKYCYAFSSNLWMQYQLPEPVIVNQYALSSANDVPGRDPRNWKLLGSLDGKKWVKLDSQAKESFEERMQTKVYSFENTTPYAYYRLHITSNNGDQATQLSEWRLFYKKK
ncbi:discoidin domain-containing protein [Chitinophaga niabensis]|uniref:F5/8 type C domain-containing protein n=1 Tax=Chitinophaga niabensis TaxID=536979 RepID=A0A1N6H3E7_9BACT|nr:discoidin domain-containing protein [Chitinophaga niabensis]SIO14286.1 F5/8 type C domain-containing protein [Chitinophaga niabensis]